MGGSKDSLKDRLAAVSRDNPHCDWENIRTNDFQAGVVCSGRGHAFPFCPCKARTHSGTRTSCTILKSKSRRAARRESSGPIRLRSPSRQSRALEKFKAKYGPEDVWKCYSKFECVALPLVRITAQYADNVSPRGAWRAPNNAASERNNIPATIPARNIATCAPEKCLRA